MCYGPICGLIQINMYMYVCYQADGEYDPIHDPCSNLNFANYLFTHVVHDFVYDFVAFVCVFEMNLSSNRITLVICFLGIFVSYFIYGVLQENM